MKMLYNEEIHTVISKSLHCLRGARYWQAEADTEKERNPHSYYGIDYCTSKAWELKICAEALYKISKSMRTARPERVATLYKRAMEIDEEATAIENG